MKLDNKLTVVATYSCDDRSAIVLHRQLDNTYIVGKNYERNGDEVSWCWGAYDISTETMARKIALAWVF